MTDLNPAPVQPDAPHRRGRLMVFFGAAPGVGKTFAMLDEAGRRRSRGTDVVVGIVETHGRARTAEKLEGLEVVPRRTIEYRGTTLEEMDVDAIIARAPEIVLVDELAHTNIPGSVHEKRWEDVHQILDAGISVVTTVNVQHLASLTDDVEAITGIRQRETVPDQVVRDADQIQLVDLSPQQLRRRLAHGNVYRPEQIDASLNSYFREGNLTALRELALLWLADRVDAALVRYRSDHAITGTWPARERVVVAVTGGSETESLIRRASRIAQRAAGSELIAVHVMPTDGLPTVPAATLAAHRALVESLGGTFHTVVGEEVPDAVVDFARGVNATMIVVGVSRHHRLRQAVFGSTSAQIAQIAGSIDVHIVTYEGIRAVRWRTRWSSLSRTRRWIGFAAAVAGPLVLTALLLVINQPLEDLSSPMMFFLALVVGVAIIGGMWPALVSAVVSALCLNYFFVTPERQFTVGRPEEFLGLGVFVVVAVAVATVVDGAGRRTHEAYQARAEASALVALSRSVLAGGDTTQGVVERLAETFELHEVKFESRVSERDPWVSVATTTRAGDDHGQSVSEIAIDDMHRLVLIGRALPAGDLQAVEAFGAQARIVMERRTLREAAVKAEALEQAEATRTALIAAVSRDLRTPLAAIHSCVNTLTSPGLVPGSDEAADIEANLIDSTQRLERLIDNLFDLSRLQSGSVQPVLRGADLGAIIAQATEPWRAGLDIDMPDDLPLVRTDPGLLERIIANLVSNAVRHGGTRVRLVAGPGHDVVVLSVIDTGPGISQDRKETLFQPFQSLDTATPGLGVGLAVADGFADAISATIAPEDTPGGGLTMVVTIPAAPVHMDASSAASHMDASSAASGAVVLHPPADRDDDGQHQQHDVDGKLPSLAAPDVHEDRQEL